MKRKQSMWMEKWMTRRKSRALQANERVGIGGETNLLHLYAPLWASIKLNNRVSIPFIEKKHTGFCEPLELGPSPSATWPQVTQKPEVLLPHYMQHQCPHNSKSKTIWEVQMSEVLQFPKTPYQWKAVANGFADRWNLLYHCGRPLGRCLYCSQNSHQHRAILHLHCHSRAERALWVGCGGAVHSLELPCFLSSSPPSTFQLKKLVKHWNLLASPSTPQRQHSGPPSPVGTNLHNSVTLCYNYQESKKADMTSTAHNHIRYQT